MDTNTEATYINTGCEGEAVRPMVAMAGRVTGIEAVGSTVDIWCQSPTGGESDSQIFHLICNTPAQAILIASQWQIRWGV